MKKFFNCYYDSYSNSNRGCLNCSKLKIYIITAKKDDFFMNNEMFIKLSKC